MSLYPSLQSATYNEWMSLLLKAKGHTGARDEEVRVLLFVQVE
jgi:hypothetical protein